MSRKGHVQPNGRHRPPKLIQCGDHSLAPWAITCVHVCEGTATDVIPIPQKEGREVDADWLCPECFEKHFLGGADSKDMSDLRAVCIHCLRRSLGRYQDNEEVEVPQ